MKKWITTILLIFIFPVSVFAKDLTVAAAANLQVLMDELVTTFEKESGATVDVVIGSSGSLTAQIANGAPFDVFMSADMSYPEVLFKKGLAAEEPKVYVYGLLVFWTSKSLDLSRPLGDVLEDPSLKKIALVNPKTAPYGRQTVNALKSLNIYLHVRPKLVYGENITQANQFILSGAADGGFTSKSSVVDDSVKDKGRWVEVDASLYEPIAQGVVVLAHAGKHDPQVAEAFYRFLFSESAAGIFKKYGYRIPA